MTYYALFLLSCFGFLLANLAAIQIVLNMNVFQKMLHLITSAEVILLCLWRHVLWNVPDIFHEIRSDPLEKRATDRHFFSFASDMISY